MTTALIGLSRDQNLLYELQTQLQEGFQVVPCDSLESLPSRLTAHPAAAVVVHLGQQTLGEYSPGRFVAELEETVENSPIYGLLASDCPPRLQKLAEKSIDHCVAMPVNYEHLRQLLANRQDLEGELQG